MIDEKERSPSVALSLSLSLSRVLSLALAWFATHTIPHTHNHTQTHSVAGAMCIKGDGGGGGGGMGIKGSPPSLHPHAKTNARPLRGGQVSTNAQLKHARALKQAVAALCQGARFSSALLPLI